MRIGSFFLILLVVLVAFGYLFSDWIHLQEDMANQQQEIERLTQLMHLAERDKQNALTSLQNTGQELQSCQQRVDLSNQVVAQITTENAYLKEQNRLLATSVQSLNTTGAPHQPQTQVAQSSAFSLVAFIVLGFGSLVTMGLKILQKQSFLKRRTAKKGNYGYLTEAEIKELVHQRRDATKSNIL